MDENETLNAIQTTAAKGISLRPEMAGVIRPFADLFAHQARCIARLGSCNLSLDPVRVRERLLSGVPVLVDLPPAIWQDAFNGAWKWMLPAIGQVFPTIESGIENISSACSVDRFQPAELASEYLIGNFQPVESTAQNIDVSAGTLGFALRTALSAALGSLVSRIWGCMENVPWYRGNCPICGAMPSIGFLSKPLADAGEFLKESGGRKFLHCSICGHDWRFDRHTCPVCENTDPELRFYLAVSGQPGERVDICRKCSRYLPCIDLRERDGVPHLDTACVCMAHLDILAQKQGFKPVSDLPWNRFDADCS